MVCPPMAKAAHALGAITKTFGCDSRSPDFRYRCLAPSINVVNTYDFPVPASPDIYK